MSSTIATLVVSLTADASQYTRGLEQAQSATNSFSKGIVGGLQGAGNSILGGALGLLKGAVIATTAVATAGAVAAGKFMYDSVQAAMEAEKVQSQLNAVLESTGGIAGVTADQVNELATALSQVTPFEDDVIVSGQNMLLTFTNIGENVFPLATETMLDMSQALGQDLQSSAIQLGKALQDPIEGVTALRRVGVNFTDAQQNMIKSLVNTGKLEEAQAYILKELQTEFGGSAKAAGETFAGKLAILQNNLGNVKETIGNAVLPMLSNLASWLSEKLASPEVQAWIEGFVSKLGQLGSWLGIVIGAVSDGGFMNLFTVFEDGSGYISGLLEIMGMSESDAQSWGLKIRDAVRTIQTGFQQAFDWLMNNKGVIVGALAAIGTAIMVSVVSAIVSAVVAAAPLILTMLAIAAVAYLIYQAWTQNWGGIQEKTQAVVAFIQNAVTTGMQTIQNIISAVMQFIQDLTSGKLGALSQLWSNVWTAITTIINTAIMNIRMVFLAFQAAFNGDWYSFGAMLRTVFDNSLRALVSVAQLAWNSIKLVFVTAINNIKNVFTTTNWSGIGKAIVDGIAKGIANGAKVIVDAAMKAAKAALQAVQGFLGIHSPSTVFEQQVGFQMAAGTAAGWETGLDKLIAPTLPQMVPAAVPAVAGLGGGGGGMSAGGVGGFGSAEMLGVLQDIRDKDFDYDKLARKVRDAVLMRSG